MRRRGWVGSGEVSFCAGLEWERVVSDAGEEGRERGGPWLYTGRGIGGYRWMHIDGEAHSKWNGLNLFRTAALTKMGGAKQFIARRRLRLYSTI